MRLLAGMDSLKQRAKTLLELADSAKFYATDTALPMVDKAAALLTKDGGLLPELIEVFQAHAVWERESLENLIKDYSEQKGIKMGVPAGVLRACLTYSNVSPSVFEIMVVLGKEESLRRLEQGKQHQQAA